MARSDTKIQNVAQEMCSSEDYECLPLKQRLKLLLASSRISFNNEVESEIVIPATAVEEVSKEKENEGCHLQSDCSDVKKMSDVISGQERHGAKVEQADDGVENQSAECPDGSFGARVQAVNCEAEMSGESLDELDHIVLKERLRSLLKRKSSELMAKVNSSGKSHPQTAGTGTTHQAFGRSGGNRSSFPRDSLGVQKNDTACFSGKRCSKYESNGRNVLSGDIGDAQLAALSNSTNIKVERPNHPELQPTYATTACQMSPTNLVLVKTEVEISDNSYEDMLDHMLLHERMKFISSRGDPSPTAPQTSECVNKLVSSSVGCRPVASKTAQSVQINRSRKKRKTATDSVETAMEEDAPGLLQVLVEKGVSVTEIKLYGEPESNDALDDSTTEDSFAELEEVISKLFFKRESLLKLGHLRGTMPEKASYCLECLFSLVEQARYLQFRNWPVEWGWCRELQSFIFVFEKHNRIVVERPEYGYATYFFELADSLPISWQIKRLVIVMKLTSCSRVTLLENKPLKVGDDLTAGEARVLMEYGWREDSGLGTMLNYCDRVVHDRKNEKESSEWRSKIGKLLMDGYNGGTIMSADIPRKVIDYNLAHPVEIKLELN